MLQQEGILSVLKKYLVYKEEKDLFKSNTKQKQIKTKASSESYNKIAQRTPFVTASCLQITSGPISMLYDILRDNKCILYPVINKSNSSLQLSFLTHNPRIGGVCIFNIEQNESTPEIKNANLASFFLLYIEGPSSFFFTLKAHRLSSLH